MICHIPFTLIVHPTHVNFKATSPKELINMLSSNIRPLFMGSLCLKAFINVKDD